MIQNQIKTRIFFTLFFGLMLCIQDVTGQVPTREDLAKNPKLFLELARKKMGWDEPAEPVKISSKIYFVGTKGLGAYLISTTEGLILLNTTMPPGGKLIEASIKKLGFKVEDIKWILSCHAHIDHVGGHAYLKKISGAKVAMMWVDAGLLEDGGKSDFHYGSENDFLFEGVKTDRLLSDGEVIRLGDVSLTAIHTPGHTKGSTTFTTTIVENGKSYFVVWPEGISVNPGYRVEVSPSYPGIGNDLRNTFHKLEMLKADIWLSSHTDFFNMPEKAAQSKTKGIEAFVDPNGYRAYIQQARQTFEAVGNAELGIKKN
jgi:metallo-beta-lactamase class B